MESRPIVFHIYLQQHTKEVMRSVKHERRSAPKIPLAFEPGERWVRALCGVVCDETVSEFIFLEVIRGDERCHECSVRYNGCEHSAVSRLEDGYRH